MYSLYIYAPLDTDITLYMKYCAIPTQLNIYYADNISST